MDDMETSVPLQCHFLAPGTSTHPAKKSNQSSSCTRFADYSRIILNKSLCVISSSSRKKIHLEKMQQKAASGRTPSPPLSLLSPGKSPTTEMPHFPRNRERCTTGKISYLPLLKKKATTHLGRKIDLSARHSQQILQDLLPIFPQAGVLILVGHPYLAVRH